MYFINHLNKNEWWKLDKEKMMVFNFNGGHHNITEPELNSSEIFECNGWHELYEAKRYCPLEVGIRWSDVWLSPDGMFCTGDAHENRAEEILELCMEKLMLLGLVID